MTSPNDRSLERIAALLAQAEGTDNENEAAMFMAKAQALATARSIDLAVARAHTKGQQRTVPIQRSIRLGAKGTKGLGTYVTLVSGIAGANDVKIDIAHDSTVVYAFGYEEDIAQAEQIFTSVLGQMVGATNSFKKSGDWKEDTVYGKVRRLNEDYDPYARWGYNPKYYYSYEQKPIPWLSARLSFQDGYARRIGERLRAAQLEAKMARIAEYEAKAVEVEDAGTPGTDLVLANKQVEVQDVYQATSRARGSWRGSYSSRSSVASGAGRSAANKANLGGQREIGGRKGELTG